MGIFKRLFRNKTPSEQPNEGYRFELVVERGNGFYSWRGDLYQSDIVRSCIRPKAKAIGKLVAKHIRESKDGPVINPEPYIRFLLEEPNPYMTGQMMQEKLATQLGLNNNAFALIIRDDNDYPFQIYPIPCVSAEAIYDKSGNLQLKFFLKNGKNKTFYYRDIIHLRRDFNNNDIFGDSPAGAITSLMEIVDTTDQGIVKAIQNSNVIKWLLRFKQVLRPEDIDKNVKDFVKNYLSIDSEAGGAAAADAKYDIEQVKPESYVPNAAQMDRTVSRIHSFFNTNEKIVQSKWTEDDFNAYFEAEIEPDAIQMSGEYSRKLFSRKERGFGNKIVFTANNLACASMKTKLDLLQMVDRGAMTPNEWREVLNMGPIAGGDKPIRRLDTAVVNKFGRLPNPSLMLRQTKNKKNEDKLPEVKEVIKTLSKDEKAELGPRYFYDDSQYRHIVKSDDKSVGFIENRATGKKGHFNLAVDPEYRSQGIADEMVDQAIEDALVVLPNLEKILWNTSESNEASRKLAEKHGFELTSMEDGVAMYTYWLIERSEE